MLRILHTTIEVLSIKDGKSVPCGPLKSEKLEWSKTIHHDVLVKKQISSTLFYAHNPE